MTIEVDSTQEEFIQAWLTPRRRKRLVWRSIMIAAGLILILSGLKRSFDSPPVFVVVGIGLVGSAIANPFQIRRVLKQLWTKHPIYGEPKTYTLDEIGFRTSGYSGESLMRWHAFSHWSETPKLFMIFFGPTTSYFIPKRCVGSEERAAELRRILNEAIGRTKYAAPLRAFPVEEMTVDSEPQPASPAASQESPPDIHPDALPTPP